MSPERDRQQEICARYGAPFVESPPHLKVGISRNVLTGLLPINGLRHLPEGGTSGWYIWAGGEGDMGAEEDFFVPLHVAHLSAWCPAALDFLGLAPGWRFLVAGNYVDVWQDDALLAID